MQTKNILIPFVGFYESIASDKVEGIIFQDFIFERGIKENKETGWLDKPDDMTDEEQTEFWDVYYPSKVEEVRKGVITDYIEHFNSELGINAVFESLSSPQYYNYTTDRLFVDVPEEELIKLYNGINKKILAEMIHERHTSIPGFTSYYENDITDPSWQDPAQYDHNQWCTVIEARVKQDDINLDELYYI